MWLRWRRWRRIEVRGPHRPGPEPPVGGFARREVRAPLARTCGDQYGARTRDSRPRNGRYSLLQRGSEPTDEPKQRRAPHARQQQHADRREGHAAHTGEPVVVAAEEAKGPQEAPEPQPHQQERGPETERVGQE